MSETLVPSACIEAVKKTSHKLVSLLSGGTVGLLDFGQALLAAEFTEQSGLNDALDPSLKISDKIDKLCQMVTTQVQQDPDKYFKAYLAILEKLPSFSSLLEATKTEYGVWLSLCVFVCLTTSISEQSQLLLLESAPHLKGAPH